MNNGSSEPEEILKAFDDLTHEQKQYVIGKLLGDRLTFVLGGNNVINNATAFQINSNSEDMSKALNNLSPQTVAELLKAVSIYISNNGC
ncbi:MAG: hypothetical protein AB4058_22375 [Microcystaceae cyanobacterium]